MSAAVLAELIESPIAPAAPRPEAPRGTTAAARGSDLYLDVFERCLLVGFFSWLVYRLIDDYLSQGHLGSLLLVPSEGLVVVFIVIRRTSRTMSHHLGEWLLAMAATSLPLLVVPGGGQMLVPEAVGATVLLMGLIVQLHAKLTLGRSLGCVPAHRGLRLGGPYRFVRHPNYVAVVGELVSVALMTGAWLTGPVALVGFGALMMKRIAVEQRALDATLRGDRCAAAGTTK